MYVSTYMLYNKSPTECSCMHLRSISIVLWQFEVPVINENSQLVPMQCYHPQETDQLKCLTIEDIRLPKGMQAVQYDSTAPTLAIYVYTFLKRVYGTRYTIILNYSMLRLLGTSQCP